MNAINTLSIGLAAALCGSALGQVDHAQDQNANRELEKVFGCWGDAQGHLSGGAFFLPVDQDARRMMEALEQANRGMIDNRVDIVVVGDGYTGAEMGQFHADADGIANSFFSYEPFISYEPYFRFTPIEVVSNESGVDNDPSQGVSRDTALDMGYWCGGTERALCVNVSKAYMAALAAPDVDQVIAIANSSMYGGVGYPSNNMATAAGHNSAAAEIAIHELGHSLGDLADEYDYGGPTVYTGGELGPIDVSIYNRSQQLAQSRKWFRWMDMSVTGFDNPINTYEGANYSQQGVYRPSSNSMMRSLGRPFNIVSAEQLIKEIYREVDPIDDGTPGGAIVSPTDTLWVLPMEPLNHSLQILWYLDEQLIPGAIQQETLDLSTLSFDEHAHTIRVEVIDPTPWVRDQAIREQFLTESRSYTVEGCALAADLTGDGAVNFFDVSSFLSAFQGQLASGDFNSDGLYNFFDISDFLNAYNSNECR